MTRSNITDSHTSPLQAEQNGKRRYEKLKISVIDTGFAQDTPTLSDELPNDICTAVSLSFIRYKLKEYLLSKALPP